MPFKIVCVPSHISFKRHVRRKMLALPTGDRFFVDLEKSVRLEQGDCLLLSDGRAVEIVAAPEQLIEIKAQNTQLILTEQNKLFSQGTFTIKHHLKVGF